MEFMNSFDKWDFPGKSFQHGGIISSWKSTISLNHFKHMSTLPNN